MDFRGFVKDADDHGISEGDVVEVSSVHGSIRAQVRVCGIRDGVLFVPFHYGYWDVADDPGEDSGLLAGVRGKVSELLGPRPEPGLLLLAQGAQAARDPELLALARRCHPQSLRQMCWANAMLKVLSPQVLAS